MQYRGEGAEILYLSDAYIKTFVDFKLNFFSEEQ